jgi:hypothetical protein
LSLSGEGSALAFAFVGDFALVGDISARSMAVLVGVLTEIWECFRFKGDVEGEICCGDVAAEAATFAGGERSLRLQGRDKAAIVFGLAYDGDDSDIKCVGAL